MFDQVAYHKKWRENNKEKIRIDGIAYRANHKDQIREAKKKYFSDSTVRERRKAYNSKYAKDHIDEARIHKREWMKRNKHAPLRRFYRGRVLAKHRGLEWNIPQSDYFELILKRCEYCDGALPAFGTGLDRMDSSKGYIAGNVVPCCFACNKVKNDVLTHEEMKVAMNAVKDFRLTKALEGISTRTDKARKVLNVV